MFTALDHFIKEYAEERKSTLKLLNALTDESLNQEVYEGGRSLGDIAWHTVHTSYKMIKEAQLEFIIPVLEFSFNLHEVKISEIYKTFTEALLAELPKQWTDAMLSEEITVYGKWKWTRSQLLNVIIKHESHHRGQMTILMRQAGLKVPGVCGPSKEEWAAMGMPIQK